MQCLIADNFQNGYTWTLVSRLGEMLKIAEDCYGERDKEYTILGIEFGPNNPRLWYPGARKHIAIQLSQKSITSDQVAYYELAHECVHLLSPQGYNAATVLEEGLATRFSHQYYFSIFNSEIKCPLESYENAMNKTAILLDADRESIKKLRKLEPVISKITAEHIFHLYPEFDRETAKELCSPFNRNAT